MLADRILSVVVPGKVIGKGRAKFVRSTGRAYTPAATVNYETAVRYAMLEDFTKDCPLDEPLCLNLKVWVEVPKSKSKKFRAAALAGEIIPTTKPDGDNVLKAVFDAGNKVIWRDDSCIADFHVYRRYGEAPALQITVERCV